MSEFYEFFDPEISARFAAEKYSQPVTAFTFQSVRKKGMGWAAARQTDAVQLKCCHLDARGRVHIHDKSEEQGGVQPPTPYEPTQGGPPPPLWKRSPHGVFVRGFAVLLQNIFVF